MKKINKLIFATLVFISTNTFAVTFPISNNEQTVIGKIGYATIQGGENIRTIAEKYNLGYNAILNANPNMDLTKAFPLGTVIELPTKYILPNHPRDGIIINLPEMRLYYFPKNSQEVWTYPVGIGKIGKTIPIRYAKVKRKKTYPIWYPPKDIREFNLKNGINLPRAMSPGPDNPLGKYAIYTSIPTYLIHSTIFPESVGLRASFGCIRMHEKDIETLFPTVTRNEPILIINQPVKVAWQNQFLYVEAHQPLTEFQDKFNATLPGMVSAIFKEVENKPVLVDWQAISYLSDERDGVPHVVGINLPGVSF